MSGDLHKATRDLTAAISAALPGRFIRLFVDLGSSLARLLSSLDLDEESLIYVGEILAAFRDNPATTGTAVAATAAQRKDHRKVDALSKRELQILALLAERLNNREIADALNISVVTVKRHATNVYAKLGVHDRRKAVAKATGLGLLE